MKLSILLIFFFLCFNNSYSQLLESTPFEWKGYIPLHPKKIIAPLDDNSVIVMSKENNKNLSLIKYTGTKEIWKKPLNDILAANKTEGDFDGFSNFHSNGRNVSFLYTTYANKTYEVHLIVVSGDGKVVKFNTVFSIKDKDLEGSIYTVFKPSENGEFILACIYIQDYGYDMRYMDDRKYYYIEEPIKAFIYNDQFELDKEIILEKEFGLDLRLDDFHVTNKGDLLTVGYSKESIEIVKNAGGPGNSAIIEGKGKKGFFHIWPSVKLFDHEDALHAIIRQDEQIDLLQFSENMAHKVKWTFHSYKDFGKEFYLKDRPRTGPRGFTRKGSSLESLFLDHVVPYNDDLLLVFEARGYGQFYLSAGVVLMRFNKNGDLVWNDYINKYQLNPGNSGHSSFIFYQNNNKLYFFTNEYGKGYVRSLDMSNVKSIVNVPRQIYDGKHKYIMYPYATWTNAGDLYFMTTTGGLSSDNSFHFLEASKLKNF